MDKISWPTVIAVVVILAVLGMVAPRLRAKVTGNSGG